MLLAIALALAADPPRHAVITVAGVDDDCCAQKVATALDALPFVESAAASHTLGQACVTLSGTLDEAAVSAALAPQGYTASAITPVSACPEGLTPKAADPWAGVTGIDLAEISKGEEVDLKAHLASGKFTIVDFGASWCGPCFGAADRIEAYARANADVAVRTVLLAGADPKASFAQPVVKQHAQWAEGLPYFLAFGPTGRPLYKGSDVDALLAAIDKKRR